MDKLLAIGEIGFEPVQGNVCDANGRGSVQEDFMGDGVKDCTQMKKKNEGGKGPRVYSQEKIIGNFN